jgi:hypothetical protein
VLTEEVADRFAEPEQVACSFFAHAYRVGVRNLPDGLSARAYTRRELDRLGLGAEITKIPWGTKHVHLPPSQLSTAPRARAARAQSPGLAPTTRRPKAAGTKGARR